MEYLAKHKITHRDLATRNVLMKRNLHVEVTDFGLSSVFAEEHRLPNKIPFRWAAIECLKNQKDDLYGEATDVWSFGVTCWEILTFAKVPYENVELVRSKVLFSMYKYLADGNRLERPENCGLELYKTLLLCKFRTFNLS
jgi:serine/threonine protein kinase